MSPKEAIKNNMIEADQIYAEKWVDDRLIEDAQKILLAPGKIREDLMRGKVMYTYIAKTSDARHHLVRKGIEGVT